MLYLGQRPFSVHEDMEHLAMMQRALRAEIPRRMVEEALSDGDLPAGVFFGEDGRLSWPERAPDEEAIERVSELLPLHEQVRPHHGAFLELLLGLLELDPRRRLAAAAALRCAFFADGEVEE